MVLLVLCNSVDYRSHLIVKHYFHIFSSKSATEILELAMHNICFFIIFFFMVMKVKGSYRPGLNRRAGHKEESYTHGFYTTVTGHWRHC